jgi:hypothetical protein
MLRALAVYCGASEPHDRRLLDVARDFGRLVASRGIRLVYGGAGVGLMGALADGALEMGGAVTGVLPGVLGDRELAHPKLEVGSAERELVLVPTMHARKALMTDRSDALVALPGGIGTLDELFEAWTWRYLGIHEKPVGLLDAFGFYTSLVRFLDEIGEAGLLGERSRRMLVVRGTGPALLDALAEGRAP